MAAPSAKVRKSNAARGAASGGRGRDQNSENRAGAWCPQQSDRHSDDDVAERVVDPASVCEPSNAAPARVAGRAIHSAARVDTSVMPDDREQHERDVTSDDVCDDQPVRRCGRDECRGRERDRETTQHGSSLASEAASGASEHQRNYRKDARAQNREHPAEERQHEHEHRRPFGNRKYERVSRSARLYKQGPTHRVSPSFPARFHRSDREEHLPVLRQRPAARRSPTSSSASQHSRTSAIASAPSDVSSSACFSSSSCIALGLVDHLAERRATASAAAAISSPIAFAASICGIELDARRLRLRRRPRRATPEYCERRRQHDRVDDLAQRVHLDEHVLDVALETHVIARLDLGFAEDAELREQLARLLRDAAARALPACGADSSSPRFSASFTHSSE